jgi:glutaredoxin
MLYIYSLEECPYSYSAEELVYEKNIPAIIYKVSRKHKEAAKRYLGNSTFPHIIYDDKHTKTVIGGFSDFKTLINTVSTLCELKIKNKITDKMFKHFVNICYKNSTNM